MKEIVIFSVAIDSTLHGEKVSETQFEVKSLENVLGGGTGTLALFLLVEVAIQLSRSASVSMFEIISAPHLLSMRRLTFRICVTYREGGFACWPPPGWLRV